MRKSIVIIGIMMSFILGSLVSAPSVYAPAGGEPFVFLQEEIDFINDLILALQEDLKKVHVTWANVDDKPPELLEMGCDVIGQIGKWDGTQWVCADEITGPSGSTEFVIKLPGPTDVTVLHPNKDVIKNFKITGLPISSNPYLIKINLIQIGANMATDDGAFQIELEVSSDADFTTFSEFFFIGVSDSSSSYRTKDNLQVSMEHIQIEVGETEKFFRLIGRTFAVDTTGSFDNLKFVMSLPLPETATIEEFIPPP